MLLGSLLVKWSIWSGSVAAGELLSLPDKVLKKVALVLGKHQDLGLLNDAAKISDELLTLNRELLRRTRKSLGSQKTVQGDVNLLV